VRFDDDDDGANLDANQEDLFILHGHILIQSSSS